MRVFLLQRLCQIAAVLLAKAKAAADLPVLPETALAATCKPLLMVTDTVDQDCFVVIHENPPYPLSVDVTRSGDPGDDKTPPMNMFHFIDGYM